MKIAIIGAGGAGLCAARHCLGENFSIDVFEQTANVGGTWNYTDYIGYDENGIPVHSSMYKGLSTNLPKELMTLEDFPYCQQDRSYLQQPEVLDYIRNYMEKFQIEPHVKFCKQVSWIEPQDDLWLVEYEDVKSKQKESGHYDAIIVCNGHYKDAFTPQIPGADSFRGGVKHSHDYRSPECYQEKKVLVIGAGPSGLQISEQILTVATRVYLSHKSKKALPVPDDLHQKPVVARLDGNRAIFEDGSVEEIDDILFCTGYNYSFPFLSGKCGVKVDDNHVHPLYKQLISIENPTLALIGLPFTVCPFPLFDIQVRFFLSTLSGHFKLPSKEEMLRELHEEMKKKSDRPPRKFHFLGDEQGRYFDDLATTAQIKRIPPVINKLYLRVRMNRNLDHCFKIIDDDNWAQ
ncbi:senecionine N-oxygenase, partial [Asbolus verrucosus]